MRSAARIYRLQLALALLGAGSIALVLLVVLRALDFSLPSADSLFAACRTLLMPDAGPGALLLLPLAALAMLSLTLGGRSLVRQVRGKRRFLARLRIVRAADLAGTQVAVFDSARPQAFCAGFLRPRIYLSTAAAALPGEHLEAVLAHERHHRRRRDPLRLLLARVVSDAFRPLPPLASLADRQRALSDLSADAAAVRALGSAQPLAAALVRFDADAGVAPERVDQLVRDAPPETVPSWLLAVAAMMLAAITAVAVSLPLGWHPPSLPLPIELILTGLAFLPACLAAGRASAYLRATA
jgi:hypothetical protein